MILKPSLILAPINLSPLQTDSPWLLGKGPFSSFSFSHISLPLFVSSLLSKFFFVFLTRVHYCEVNHQVVKQDNNYTEACHDVADKLGVISVPGLAFVFGAESLRITLPLLSLFGYERP